jgi:DNA relaxase NicK
MRFDWYAASIDAKPKTVLLGLFDALKCDGHEETKARNGYENAQALTRGGEKVATVFWGGNGGLPFAWASGEDAPAFAEALRGAWTHRITRADVAEDFTDPGAWESLSGRLVGVVDDHRINLDHMGDHHRAERGRTLQAGSRKSIAMMRLYEKGKQLQQDPNWVRAEIEVKPKRRDVRELLSKAEPGAFWGVSKWAAEYYEFMMCSEIDRIEAGTIFRESDYDRRVKWMFRQYGKTLAEMLQNKGSAYLMGKAIETKLIEDRFV